MLARLRPHPRRIDETVAAHPDLVIGLRQVGNDIAAFIVGDDDLGEAGRQIGGLGDDPDAGLRLLSAPVTTPPMSLSSTLTSWAKISVGKLAVSRTKPAIVIKHRSARALSNMAASLYCAGSFGRLAIAGSLAKAAGSVPGDFRNNPQSRHRRETSFLRRGNMAESRVAVREAAEAADDVVVYSAHFAHRHRRPPCKAQRRAPGRRYLPNAQRQIEEARSGSAPGCRIRARGRRRDRARGGRWQKRAPTAEHVARKLIEQNQQRQRALGICLPRDSYRRRPPHRL